MLIIQQLMESVCVTINKIDSYATLSMPSILFLFILWNFNSKHILYTDWHLVDTHTHYTHFLSSRLPALFHSYSFRSLYRSHNSHIHFNGELCIQTFVCFSHGIVNSTMTQDTKRHYRWRINGMLTKTQCMTCVWLEQIEVKSYTDTSTRGNKSQIYSGFSRHHFSFASSFFL